MRVYKYRSLDQLGFALDILFSNRLYCANAETLNDPMDPNQKCRLRETGSPRCASIRRSTVGCLRTVSHKRQALAYEKEVRIVANVDGLDEGCFYRLTTKPRALYLGFRMPHCTKFALGTVCEKMDIPLAIVSPMATEIPSLRVNFPLGMKWPGGLIKLPQMPTD